MTIIKNTIPVPPTPEEIEEQVQQNTNDILQNNDRDVAIAMATVRLVKFAVSNPTVIQNATEKQIAQRFRDEVVNILRQRKGD
jgi:hypothetical protein